MTTVVPTSSLIFDRAGTMERVDNDQALFMELITIFKADYPNQLGPLKLGCAAADAAAVSRSAHALKSASGNIGAMRVYDVAYALEKAGRAGTLANAPAMIVQLEEEICSYLYEIDSAKG